MSKEHQPIPDWAQQERQADLGWIKENLDGFWSAATTAFASIGRGIIIVDTRVVIPEAGHPFIYLGSTELEEFGDPDMQRLVKRYEPASEFVVALLKEQNRTSSYRVRMVGIE